MRAIMLGFLGFSGLVWAGSVQAQTAPLPPASPPVVREPNAEPTARSTRAESSATLTRADVQELIEAARATAKATREGVDYSRTVPDILQQILAKLDKIENKLDKLETKTAATKRSSR
jgi:uncharacterized iron-regulated membrane protein